MAGKKQDTSKKRESILDGAVKAFCDEGYESTSMDRIAQFAGASKRTVYNHFSSKEALFQAVIDRFIEQSSALKKIPYDSDQSLDVQLTAFADAKTAMVEDPASLGLFKAVLGAFIGNPELGQRTMENAQKGENYLVIWLLAAKKDGKLRFQDAELTAEVFWDMISGAFIWPQVMMGPLPAKTIKAKREELVEVFLSRYRA
jgi:TetR/AcrR family transcriptional regulator, regulator of autoinduction and epiphytic fitness